MLDPLPETLRIAQDDVLAGAEFPVSCVLSPVSCSLPGSSRKPYCSFTLAAYAITMNSTM